MIKKRYARASCFFAAALLFTLMEPKAVVADSFLNPARNAYSLSKTADRPFLQSVPVPQVWQTDTSSQDFKRAWLDAVLPETPAERLFKANSWQIESFDLQKDFQTIVFENQRSDKREIANVLNEIMPVIVVANDVIVDEVEKIESDFDRYQISLSRQDADKLTERLIEINSFSDALEETAFTDVEMDILKKFFQKKEKQEKKIEEEIMEDFLSDDILKQAENIFSLEKEDAQENQAVEEIIWSLLLDDLMDLSTGTFSLMRDDAFPPEEKFENPYRSASLLDRAEKTDQIQEDGFLKEKQALMKRLLNVLERSKIKGVR